MKILKSIDLFLDHCEFEKNLSEKTIVFYRIDLLQFLDFVTLQKVRVINKIDKHIVKAYVQHLSKFEPRTVKRKIASSKAYLNFLEFEDYIVVNPYRKIRVRIKEPKQLPVVLELEEIQSLLSVVKKEGDKVSDKGGHQYMEKVRDLAILELLFATGIRVSELYNLTNENINLESGKVLVNGKGNKERIVQVCNPETLKTLEHYYKLYEDRLAKSGFFLSAA
ncbi:MAG: tyrosine-type recombinase/integrase [Cyclobacteriaceae bacterium]